MEYIPASKSTYPSKPEHDLQKRSNSECKNLVCSEMALSLKPNVARTPTRTYFLLLQCLSFLISTVAIPFSTNITAPILTLPTNDDISRQCTSRRTWIGHEFRQSDCISATDRIFTEAMGRRGQEYEFLSPGAAPKTSLPKIMTPRKYSHDSCVATIAMLNQFKPRELPGSDIWDNYEETDVALLENAWYAALTVDFACLQYDSAGWIAMGR